MTITLNAKPREERGKKVKKLRKAGVIPGVLYGPKEESQAISLDQVEFEKVFKKAGESTIIDLVGAGEKEKEVLVQNVDYDVLTGHPSHVDLYAIEAGKKLTVNVPLDFVGEAPIEKHGGILTKVLYEIEIEAAPRDLPHDIKVDVSVLTELDSHILVKDLTIPTNVEVLNALDDTVVTVAEYQEEPEEVPEEVDMDAVEVEHKGKEADADDDAGDSNSEDS